jgi:hypothetical protein
VTSWFRLTATAAPCRLKDCRTNRQHRPGDSGQPRMHVDVFLGICVGVMQYAVIRDYRDRARIADEQTTLSPSKQLFVSSVIFVRTLWSWIAALQRLLYRFELALVGIRTTTVCRWKDMHCWREWSAFLYRLRWSEDHLNNRSRLPFFLLLQQKCYAVSHYYIAACILQQWYRNFLQNWKEDWFVTKTDEWLVLFICCIIYRLTFTQTDLKIVFFISADSMQRQTHHIYLDALFQRFYRVLLLILINCRKCIATGNK